MPFRVFSIPATDDGSNAEALNAFLRTVRVITVERHLVTHAQASAWTFCVEYLEAGRAAQPGAARETPKTDYRETLDPDTFTRFARLRQARKRWAEEAGVPVYAIFTNAQLAAVAQAQPATVGDLQAIDGIGPAKASTYGERVLALIHTDAATPLPTPPSTDTGFTPAGS